MTGTRPRSSQILLILRTRHGSTFEAAMSVDYLTKIIETPPFREFTG